MSTWRKTLLFLARRRRDSAPEVAVEERLPGARRALVASGVALAGAAEILSWWFLTAEQDPGSYAFAYALAHGGSCLMLAVGLQSSLPRQYRTSRRQNLLLFFSIAFFVPYLGPMGISVCSFYALRRPYPEETADWVLWPEPTLPVSSTFTRSKHLRRHGAMFEILQNSRDSAKRVHAVIATRHMRDRVAVPVLRAALKDSEDEVRLQAYAFLDRRQQAIGDRIKVLLERLETTEGKTTCAAHRLLALNYWEMVYAGIVQGSVRNHILESAREHGEKALGDSDTEPGLQLLLGHIRLQQGRAEQARGHLELARSAGIPECKLAPYFAEAAFVERDFEAVANSLSRVDPIARGDVLLASLVEYWCELSRDSVVHQFTVGAEVCS